MFWKYSLRCDSSIVNQGIYRKEMQGEIYVFLLIACPKLQQKKGAL